MIMAAGLRQGPLSREGGKRHGPFGEIGRSPQRDLQRATA